MFTAVATDGIALPVKASIYVGDYQARATPIADTDPATDRAEPRRTASSSCRRRPTCTGTTRIAYRAYNFVANAPGYGHVRFKVEALKPGETRNIVDPLPDELRLDGARARSRAGDGVFQATS